jgi:S-adenosylmethionine/arginine decarboxylase-like enzyme
MVNDTTVDNPATSTITVSTNASGVSTVEAGDDADTESDDGLLPGVGNLLGPDTSASYDASDVPASSDGVVIVEAQNSDYADGFTSLVDSDAAEGAVVPATVQVNGNYEEVYYQSAPDAASGTYTVLEDDGDIRVHTGDDFDESSIDVSTSNDALGPMDAFNAYGVSGDFISAALPF